MQTAYFNNHFNCGVICGEDRSKTRVFRVFLTVFVVKTAVCYILRQPLTPSLVGSNLGPATYAVSLHTTFYIKIIYIFV